jgi:hypothetical protein
LLGATLANFVTKLRTHKSRTPSEGGGRHEPGPRSRLSPGSFARPVPTAGSDAANCELVALSDCLLNVLLDDRLPIGLRHAALLRPWGAGVRAGASAPLPIRQATPDLGSGLCEVQQIRILCNRLFASYILEKSTDGSLDFCGERMHDLQEEYNQEVSPPSRRNVQLHELSRTTEPNEEVMPDALLLHLESQPRFLLQRCKGH